MFNDIQASKAPEKSIKDLYLFIKSDQYKEMAYLDRSNLLNSYIENLYHVQSYAAGLLSKLSKICNETRTLYYHLIDNNLPIDFTTLSDLYKDLAILLHYKDSKYTLEIVLKLFVDILLNRTLAFDNANALNKYNFYNYVVVTEWLNIVFNKNYFSLNKSTLLEVFNLFISKPQSFSSEIRSHEMRSLNDVEGLINSFHTKRYDYLNTLGKIAYKYSYFFNPRVSLSQSHNISNANPYIYISLINARLPVNLIEIYLQNSYNKLYDIINSSEKISSYYLPGVADTDLPNIVKLSLYIISVTYPDRDNPNVAIIKDLILKILNLWQFLLMSHNVKITAADQAHKILDSMLNIYFEVFPS